MSEPAREGPAVRRGAAAYYPQHQRTSRLKADFDRLTTWEVRSFGYREEER